MNKPIFLCCLPALFLASAARTSADAGEVLVVAPGEALRLTAPEAGARVEAALDGGPLAPVGNRLDAPGSGDHWLAVASRDRSGNLSPIRWIRLRVDGEPPRVELRTDPAPVAAADRSWVPAQTEVAAFAVDSPAGVASLSLAVGGKTREVAAESLSAPLPSEGPVTVHAWAVDRVGNRSTETSLDFAVDGSPPGAEIYATGPHVAIGADTVLAPDAAIGVDVRDDGSGVASWTPRIDGEEAPAAALDGPWTAGAHAVAVTAVDLVGNEGRVGPFRFTVDAAGPEIAWRLLSRGVEGAGGVIFYRPPVEVEASATDAPAGIEGLQAADDGKAYRPLEGPIRVDGDELFLRSTDKVGNVSEVRASWPIDVEPPEIALAAEDGEAIAPGGRATLERGAAIRVLASDRGAGIESSTYSLSVESASIGRRWWWWPPRDQPLPEELVFPWAGRFVLSVETFDRLGNRSTARWDVTVHNPQRGGS